MGGLRDILRRAFGGRSPEEALADFKERLHTQINEFKENPETHHRLQRVLQSLLNPLQQFNTFLVRPALADKERLRSLAKRFDINKVELKRVLKTSLELEEKLKDYFENRDQLEQLIVTLRKVINVLDEDIITGLIDAVDYNIDYGKIEKAYLDYQTNLQKAYNAEGLNRDLQGLMGTVMQNLKNAFNNNQKVAKIKPSDRQADARMLEPELQNLYDRYRDEGFTHEESMRVVDEKRDLDGLPPRFREAYRTLRREGRSHADALDYARNLADKSQDQNQLSGQTSAETTDELADEAAGRADHTSDETSEQAPEQEKPDD
ncbi:MAG: hypothetical protein ACAI44_01065 [Candidatus Sericytochromatia bacterium]